MKVLVFALAAIIALALPAWAFQGELPQYPTPRTPAMTGDDPAVKTADGEISKVDPTAKTITLKGTAPNSDRVFYYDDKTQFAGVSGITGFKVGSMVKVSYREQSGKNFATKVEAQTKK